MEQTDTTPAQEQSEVIPELNESIPEQGAASLPDGMSALEANGMSALEERLEKAEVNAQEHQDAWLRAKAEGENIRRRAQEDISKAQKFAVERFSNEMLAVKDSLEAGLAITTENVESFKSGMELTLKQLSSAFEKFNIKEINPLGEKFDAHKHQAIGMLDSEQEANTVVSVMQKGYALHDRVLRPALVMVAKGKE